MIYSSTWLKRSFFAHMSVYYFVAVFFFGIMQQQKMPPLPVFLMQISAVVLTVMFSYLYSRKSIAVTCSVVFLFQLFASLALRMFNYDFFHNPLGYNPADAEWYDQMATQFYRGSVRELTMFLDSAEILLDDRGFNYLLFYIYKIAGTPARGVNLATFFNVVIVTGSAYFLYKAATTIMEDKYAELVAFVWGTQLYAVYTAAAGLKENVMVFFVVAALYFIARLWHEYSLLNVVMAVLLSMFALLFRMALFYMLVASLLTVTAIKFPFIRKYLVFFIVVGVIFTLVYFRLAMSEMVEIRGNAIDQETYEGMVANKMERSGPFSTMVSYISALIGPFPNIVSYGEKANYITLFSFSSFCKTFYAMYFLYSIYLLFKNKVVQLLPFLVFWAFDILMLIVTYYTLHDRYHWPHVPIVILLSVWGAVQWSKSKPKNATMMRRLYVIILFIILIAFNYR